ncbi:hypothetical protein BRC83_10470 [Halobacteriales archaeon QS_1_68_17]|nr:MAG: hypothetical protein BRC83_10470 [Halobacteriales archaeon QS_1_68_17]
MTDIDAETTTVTLEADGETDDLELPTALIGMLAEGGESAPTVVGDIAMFGFAQRIHGAVHHSRDEPSDEIKAVEEATLALFEDRFGQSFAELTGHDH